MTRPLQSDLAEASGGGGETPIDAGELRTGTAEAIDAGELRTGTAGAIDAGELRTGTAETIDAGEPRTGTAETIDAGELRAGTAEAIDAGEMRTGTAEPSAPLNNIDPNAAPRRNAILRDGEATGRIWTDEGVERLWRRREGVVAPAGDGRVANARRRGEEDQ
jgi:hypothetical protein